MDPTSSDEPAPRFCDQCAASLVPLSVPHVARTCNTCQRTIHLVEPGDDGKGLKIRKGDTFTIPAGSITMSLDPTKSTGRFFRPGLTWFVRRILTGDLPTTAEGLDALTTTWEQVADEILVNSEKLTGYDLDDKQDAEKAIELIKQDQRSIEFWALTVGSLCHDLRDRLASEEERAAALSALRLATFWAMLVFVRDLEDHVWTGYNQNQLIYGIAKAGAQTPAEAAAIAALEPAFKRLGEAVLTAWVEAGVDMSATRSNGCRGTASQSSSSVPPQPLRTTAQPKTARDREPGPLLVPRRRIIHGRCRRDWCRVGDSQGGRHYVIASGRVRVWTAGRHSSRWPSKKPEAPPAPFLGLRPSGNDAREVLATPHHESRTLVTSRHRQDHAVRVIMRALAPRGHRPELGRTDRKRVGPSAHDGPTPPNIPTGPVLTAHSWGRTVRLAFSAFRPVDEYIAEYLVLVSAEGLEVRSPVVTSIGGTDEAPQPRPQSLPLEVTSSAAERAQRKV